MHLHSQHSHFTVFLGPGCPGMPQQDSATRTDRLQLHQLLLHLPQPPIPTCVTTKRCPGYRCPGIETSFLKTQISLENKASRRHWKAAQVPGWQSCPCFLPGLTLSRSWACAHSLRAQVNYHNNSFQVGRKQRKQEKLVLAQQKLTRFTTEHLLPFLITLRGSLTSPSMEAQFLSHGCLEWSKEKLLEGNGHV